MSIPIQTRVRNSEGKFGTVCPDLMFCCLPEEAPVVYDGTDTFLGTLESELTVLGPEDVKPDVHKGGAGKGPGCCMFLTVGPGGFNCERFSDLRHAIVFRKDMNAKRHPTEPYPLCMNQPDG